MKMPLHYDSPQHIAQFLENSSIAPRKRWGQNFLINAGAKEKIVNLLTITKETHLLEIGPGLGAMTYLALQSPVKSFTVFEIDPAYQDILTNFFGDYPQFSLVKGDVLRTWQDYINQHPDRIFTILGNLPYNISSAIIQLLAHTPFDRAILTVQKELAERLMANPKTKNYSSLSVWAQANFTIHSHGVLKAGSFYPQPNVDSAIISLHPRVSIDKALLPLLDHIVKAAFSHRRKILKHNWHALPTGPLSGLEKSIIDNHINPEIYLMRAEELPPHYYVELAKQLSQYI